VPCDERARPAQAYLRALERGRSSGLVTLVSRSARMS
jgi:hypothetical protein